MLRPIAPGVIDVPQLPVSSAPPAAKPAAQEPAPASLEGGKQLLGIEPAALPVAPAPRAAEGAIRDWRAALRTLTSSGLVPHLVVVAPGRGQPQAFTYEEAGKDEVALLVRTPDGQIPPPLAQALADLKIAKIEQRPALGIAGAAPLDVATTASPQQNYRYALTVTDSVLKHAGFDVGAPEHAIMRYSIARYILGGATDAALSWLAKHFDGPAEALIHTGQLGPRWVEKIERTLKDPFTNAACLERLRFLQTQLQDSLRWIEKENTGGAPIAYYLAGSITKGRFNAGSDLDLLIDTPDKDLEQKILKGPFGHYGGADRETYAILNVQFYWERGPYFGTPFAIGDDLKALLKPDALVDIYKTQSRRAWGVNVCEQDGATTVSFDDKARSSFQREAPIFTEWLYQESRHFRPEIENAFVTQHFDALLGVPEAAYMPAKRLIELGEQLLAERLMTAKIPEYETRLTTDPMGLADALGITDPVERLAVDFAARERMKQAARAKAAPKP